MSDVGGGCSGYVHVKKSGIFFAGEFTYLILLLTALPLLAACGESPIKKSNCWSSMPNIGPERRATQRPEGQDSILS